MSSTFSAVGDLGSGPTPAVRARRVPESIARAMTRITVRLGELRAQCLAQVPAGAGNVAGNERETSALRFSAHSARLPGDVLAGQSAVVIPLNRAVVCGEDHVYDVGQFNVCPNCAAEERLALVELLAHERKPFAPGCVSDLIAPAARASANRQH